MAFFLTEPFRTMYVFFDTIVLACNNAMLQVFRKSSELTYMCLNGPMYCNVTNLLCSEVVNNHTQLLVPFHSLSILHAFTQRERAICIIHTQQLVQNSLTLHHNMLTSRIFAALLIVYLATSFHQSTVLWC